MNSPAKPKKSWLPTGDNSKQRLLFMIAGAGTLLIILILIINALFGGKNNTDALVELAQRQTEIIRVADIGFEKAETSQTRGLAMTIKLSVQTTENQTIDRLKKLGKKVKARELALKKNSKTDQTLTAAGLNNTFDKTFAEIIQTSLNEYRAAVRQVYEATKNQAEKQFLAAGYNGVGLLINQ